MKPKVVFIDWYKTLSNSVFWEHLENEDREKYDLIVNSFLKSFGDLINPWMRGKFTSEDMAKKIAEDTNLNEKYILDGLKKSTQDMAFAEDRIVDLIKQLRSNDTKVIVATDNMDTFIRWTVPQMKLDKLFNGILNSWELKRLKGDFEGGSSKFFSKYLKANSLSPAECLLIDDSEDKESRLSDFGINYVRINSTSDVVDIIVDLL